jgi:hypothetical protein
VQSKRAWDSENSLLAKEEECISLQRKLTASNRDRRDLQATVSRITSELAAVRGSLSST